MVQLLLQAGSSVDCDALIIAAQRGHVKVVQELIGWGADVNRKHKGHTAMDFAAHKGHLQVMEILSLEKSREETN